MCRKFTCEDLSVFSSLERKVSMSGLTACLPTVQAVVADDPTDPDDDPNLPVPDDDPIPPEPDPGPFPADPPIIIPPLPPSGPVGPG